MRDDLFDPPLKATDLGVQHDFESIVHILEIGGDVLLPARRDLRRKPFAHVDDLRPSCGQSPENTQVFARQRASGVRSEQHEPGNKFCIDPVCLCARAPGKGKCLDLRRRQLACVDSCRNKRGSEHPFLTTRRFKPDVDRARHLPENRDQQFVALGRVRQSEPLLIGKAKPVQPIAGHIYPDHGRCWTCTGFVPVRCSC